MTNQWNQSKLVQSGPIWLKLVRTNPNFTASWYSVLLIYVNTRHTIWNDSFVKSKNRTFEFGKNLKFWKVSRTRSKILKIRFLKISLPISKIQKCQRKTQSKNLSNPSLTQTKDPPTRTWLGQEKIATEPNPVTIQTWPKFVPTLCGPHITRTN